MRALVVALLVIATVIPAGAESSLVSELRFLSTRYHENLPRNPADWTMKDVPDAKALLAQIKART